MWGIFVESSSLQNSETDRKVALQIHSGVEIVMSCFDIMCVYVCVRACVRRNSSVGIATRYGLDGPGIDSRWGRYFQHPSRLTQPSVQWVPGLLQGLEQPGVTLTSHPFVLSSERKSRTISLFPVWVFIACSMVNFTFICMYVCVNICTYVCI
jgi:hypothetical protein